MEDKLSLILDKLVEIASNLSAMSGSDKGRDSALETKHASGRCDAAIDGKMLSQRQEIDDLRRQLETAKADALKEACRMRAEKLFQNVAKTCWRIVRSYRKAGGKCDRCDENGWIHYDSPSGLRVMETCRCRWRRLYYLPEAIQIYEGRFLGGELMMWYRGADDYSPSISLRDFRFYDGGDFTEEMEKFVFRKEEDAERCAEWLNMNAPASYADQVIRIEHQWTEEVDEGRR